MRMPLLGSVQAGDRINWPLTPSDVYFFGNACNGRVWNLVKAVSVTTFVIGGLRGSTTTSGSCVIHICGRCTHLSPWPKHKNRACAQTSNLLVWGEVSRWVIVQQWQSHSSPIQVCSSTTIWQGSPCLRKSIFAFSRCPPPPPHPAPTILFARSRSGTVGLFLVHFHLMKARGTLTKRSVRTTWAGQLCDCRICLFFFFFAENLRFDSWSGVCVFFPISAKASCSYSFCFSSSDCVYLHKQGCRCRSYPNNKFFTKRCSRLSVGEMLNKITWSRNTTLDKEKKEKKRRTIVVMHHLILKNLQSDFAAMHRCVKSRQTQVTFARGSAAESSTLIPRYHKSLILCISSVVLFLSRVVSR